MRLVSALPLLLASGVLAVALAGLPASTASELQPIAESSQVKLTGSVSAGQLTLRVLPAVSGAPLVVTGLSASLDGVPAPVTRQADDSWRVPLPAAPRSRLDVFVLHDGIREVLSGSLPARGAIGSVTGVGAGAAAANAGTASGGGAGRSGAATPPGRHNYKQLAWWVLNIAVVLIAVIAISRRMS
jgi:hypothetical protein